MWYVNKIYGLYREKNEHIFICSYEKYNDKYFLIKDYCKNSHVYTINTKVKKHFFSYWYLKEKLGLQFIVSYRDNFNNYYIIGTWNIPEKETRQYIFDIFNENTNKMYYIDKVVNFILN